MRKAICDKCDKEMKMQIGATIISVPGDLSESDLELSVDLCGSCQRRLIAWTKESDPKAG